MDPIIEELYINENLPYNLSNKITETLYDFTVRYVPP